MSLKEGRKLEYSDRIFDTDSHVWETSLEPVLPTRLLEYFVFLDKCILSAQLKFSQRAEIMSVMPKYYEGNISNIAILHNSTIQK